MSFDQDGSFSDMNKTKVWLDANSQAPPSSNETIVSNDTKASDNSGDTKDTKVSHDWSGASEISGASKGSGETGTDTEGDDKPPQVKTSEGYFAEQIASLEKDDPALKKQRDVLNGLAMEYAKAPTDDAWLAWENKYKPYWSSMDGLQWELWFTVYYSTLTREQMAPRVFHAYIKKEGEKLTFQSIDGGRLMDSEYTKLIQLQGCGSVIKDRWIDACRSVQEDYTWHHAELTLFAAMYRDCPNKPTESKDGEEKEKEEDFESEEGE